MKEQVVKPGVEMDRKNISCCFSTSVDTEHRTVLLEITNRCNLACGYCHARAGTYTDLVMSDEQIVNLLHEMAENNITKVILSGGEPLLHKGIRRYTDIIESLGMEVDLCTNGTIMNDDILEWIKAHFSDVTITLDTMNPDAYAEMKCCDRSMHEKVINNTKLLIDSDVRVGITIVPTIVNYKELPDVIDKLYKMGVSSISILRLYKMEGITDYLFDEADFFKTIDDMIKPYENMKFRLKGFGLEPESMGKCPAGEGMLGIGYDGRLYPCLLLRNTEWSVDLCKSSFKEAIHSDVMNSFINLKNGICNKACKHNAVCQYGCPAAAYIENSNISCDIRCDFFKDSERGN